MRGRRLWTIALAAAHAVPAMLLWGLLGAVLAGRVSPLAVAVAAAAYAALYGAAETLRVPVRPPSLNWQVPSAWVRERSSRAKIAIWGALLGSGLFTRNPYAGMWLVPLALALVGNPRAGALVGLVAGGAHGIARALGVRSNIRVRRGRADIALVVDQLRWKLVDGLALLVAAGILVAAW